MDQKQPSQTITVDGHTYELDQLPANIKQAVAIYNRFTNDLNEAQLSVIKCQAAVSTVGQQIAEAIKSLASEKMPDGEVAQQ